MDYSLPGSSVHGISQPRILEWVVISFSRCVSLIYYIRLGPYFVGLQLFPTMKKKKKTANHFERPQKASSQIAALSKTKGILPKLYTHNKMKTEIFQGYLVGTSLQNIDSNQNDQVSFL